MRFEPHEYQRNCISQILNMEQLGLFLEMGLGPAKR
jgi:hypothetical protein